MKFLQTSKRILLFLAVNFLVVTTIMVIASLLLRGRFHQYQGLFIFCLIWGMVGSFISLALSRWMAKLFMGVEVVDPNSADPDEQRLLSIVQNLARTAGVPMPEVGVYHSPEVNAFATGPSKNKALVAVSSGLLRNMRQSEVEGVLGHEMAHVANGDMVTMSLIQGVINAFVMFLAYVLAFAVEQAMSSRDNQRGGGSPFMRFMLIQLFQFVFSILGFIVVAWFSRWREFRADAGGARFAGRENMISALKALQRIHERGADEAEQVDPAHAQPAFQALKISGKTNGVALLFATHPPLEERIARLENPTLS